ncbi:MAG: hypothetical protein WCW68_01635 [Methanothrix sp.]
MVFQMKGVGRDESLRMDQLGKKLEVCQVYRVWTHNDPEDKNWQSCDVIIQDSVPLNPAGVGDDGPAVRLRVPVLQRHIGNRSGTPWTPRVGDSVLVGFYMNDRPVIIGTLPPQYQIPVCRSSANPGTLPEGAREDWTEPDYHNYYDWRFRLDQWLHVPRRCIIDQNGKEWPTTFDQNQVVQAGKLRPVCFSYFDKTRDFMAVFECKAGKATPDCKKCELNGDGTGDGPDTVTCCSECCGEGETNPAMNAFLKILSSDYTGRETGCAADLPRRLKYHHPCGSLFCMDSDYPANEKFTACNKHRGRIYLESQESHTQLGHLHFRAEANLAGTIYPDNPQGYGKFNVSLRGGPTKAAHFELWGENDLKGRVDMANEEIGLVQDGNIHCGTPDAHVSIRQTDGIIQVHSLGQSGEIYAVAALKVTIQACTGTKIEVNADGTVNITAPTKVTVTTPECEFTGNVKIDGTCTHGACSCGV